MFRLQHVLPALVLCAVAIEPAPAQSTHYSYSVQTVAGSYRLGDGGPATSALMEPFAVTSGPGRTFYVGEKGGRLRRVKADGSIETLATFPASVYSLAVDPAGNVYAGTAEGIVYRIAATGIATPVAGGGFSFKDGIDATSAFIFPLAIAVDAGGRILIDDYFTSRIRAVDSKGTITTIAGTGENQSTGDGGPATAAGLDNPSSVAVDSTGKIYIAEYGRIRMIGLDGLIKTIAGDGTWSSWGENMQARDANVAPDRIAVDSTGAIYICEGSFDVIRRIGSDGVITRVAGNYDTGYSGDGSPAVSAMLDMPFDVAVDSENNLLISDFGNARIRRVTAGGSMSTVAGKSHFGGDGGPALEALFRAPTRAVYDPAGNLNIVDFYNRRIRQVTTGGIVRTLAGNGYYSPKPDNVPASSSAVGTVTAIAVDPNGNLIYGGYGAIRKIDAATGNVSTLAGNTSTYGNSGDGGPASSARFRTVDGLAWDMAGNLYVSDANNNRVRRISKDGIISGFAGTGRAEQGGDGGKAISADISAPSDLAFDSKGNLYILSEGSQIRVVAPDGIISTAVEFGLGDALDEVPRAANTVSIGFIDSLAVDSTDTLYFTTAGMIAAYKDGKVWRIAGGEESGFAGDGGPAMNARFGNSLYLSAGPGRTLVVGDSEAHRVRTLTLLDPRLAEIAGGDKQTAPAGSKLGQPLAVRVSGVGGVPAAVVPVQFAVASGTGTLSADTVMTDATGVAKVEFTPLDAGAVKVSAKVEGLPALVFTATATAPPGGGTPTISDGGITGAALSVPPVRAISPNAIVTVWGTNFIAAGTQRRLTTNDLVNGRIPTMLGGICVEFGGVRAPIFDVYPSQLNIQVPAISGSKTSVRVLRNCGQSDETASTPAEVAVAPMSPEFFAFSYRQDGHVPIAARLHPTNRIVGPAGAYVEPSEPAKPGSIVTIYGTGFGLTEPAYQPGELPTNAASPSAAPSVVLGGITLNSTDVLYAGVTPGNAGLYQLNIRIPESVPDGEQPIILKLGDVSTPAGPYLLIKRDGGSNTQ